VPTSVSAWATAALMLSVGHVQRHHVGVAALGLDLGAQLLEPVPRGGWPAPRRRRPGQGAGELRVRPARSHGIRRGVVGGGPAGLATAIRLKQLARAKGKRFGGGAREGLRARRAHPVGRRDGPARADRADPRLEGTGAPLNQPVTDDDVLFLTETAPRKRTPTGCCRATSAQPRQLRRQPGQRGAWLASRPKALGVEIFPGFAAAEVLYDDAGPVKGVATGNMGIGKDGEPATASSSAWSCTASTPCSPKARAATWASSSSPASSSTKARPADLRPSASRSCGRSTRRQGHQPGLVVHTAGWPMDNAHLRRRLPLPPGRQQGHAGLRHRAGLQNPYLSPFEEMQRWKTHPAIRAHIEGGKRIGYGARAITTGGLQSLPKLVFPGGALVGLRRRLPERRAHQGQPRRHQDRHAGRRGRLRAWPPGRQHDELTPTRRPSSKSWLHDRAAQTRNFKPGSRRASGGHADDGIEQWLLPKATSRARPGRCTTSPTTPPAARRRVQPIATPSPTASSPSTACRRCSSATPTTKRTSPRT
jgi:electron-transferring-flavoprotein dehydrogenase